MIERPRSGVTNNIKASDIDNYGIKKMIMTYLYKEFNENKNKR